ncbi:histone H1, orphon-like [Daktulosphaira vitifoliae]|uniref:histone H1, orphon-like n=1 Tax=Daktulosphaira vitifoliae TaxID=58002 RepID=UPI0021AA3BDB|nr:histone H1, orphon-like [Daktulosphaira vitifoliae]
MHIRRVFIAFFIYFQAFRCLNIVMVRTASQIVVKFSQKNMAPSKAKKVTASHPTTATMVLEALKELKEKKGSSIITIKKFLNANYKVDTTKLGPFIKKFLVTAVADGQILQTKGKGANGHFKLPSQVIKKVNSKKINEKKIPVVKKLSTTKKSKLIKHPAKIIKIPSVKEPSSKIKKTTTKAKNSLATIVKLPKSKRVVSISK